MNIVYKDTHDFSSEQLQELFLSVEWSSGHYPDKLVTAMKNFETVFSAWDDNKLAGIICAMDDGTSLLMFQIALDGKNYLKI